MEMLRRFVAVLVSRVPKHQRMVRNLQGRTKVKGSEAIDFTDRVRQIAGLLWCESRAYRSRTYDSRVSVFHRQVNTPCRTYQLSHSSPCHCRIQGPDERIDESKLVCFFPIL